MSLPAWLTGISPTAAELLAHRLQRLALEINTMHGQAVEEQIALLGEVGEDARDAFYLANGRSIGIHKVHTYVLDLVEALRPHARPGAEGLPAQGSGGGADQAEPLELQRLSDGGWVLARGDVCVSVGDDGMRRVSDVVRWAPVKEDDWDINEGYGRLLCQVCGEPGNAAPDRHVDRHGHAPVVVPDTGRHVYVGGGSWGLEPESWTIDEGPR